ncbi:MAG: hypothetical protein R6V85_05345 [Polyangia bacterium]
MEEKYNDICKGDSEKVANVLEIRLREGWKLVAKNASIRTENGAIVINIENRTGEPYRLYSAPTMRKLIYIRAYGINDDYRVVGSSFIPQESEYLLAPGNDMSIEVDVNESLRRGLLFVPERFSEKWSFLPGEYMIDIYIVNPANKIKGVKMYFCP